MGERKYGPLGVPYLSDAQRNAVLYGFLSAVADSVHHSRCRMGAFYAFSGTGLQKKPCNLAYAVVCLYSAAGMVSPLLFAPARISGGTGASRFRFPAHSGTSAKPILQYPPVWSLFFYQLVRNIFLVCNNCVFMGKIVYKNRNLILTFVIVSCIIVMVL